MGCRHPPATTSLSPRDDAVTTSLAVAAPGAHQPAGGGGVEGGMPGSPRTLSSLLGSAVLSPQCHPATLSLRPRILTAAPAPSCRQKPPAPPLQSGSPSAAWGSKDTRTAGGCWTGTLCSSRQQAVKWEQGPGAHRPRSRPQLPLNLANSHQVSSAPPGLMARHTSRP